MTVVDDGHPNDNHGYLDAYDMEDVEYRKLVVGVRSPLLDDLGGPTRND
jgi:hypothetical protein